MRCDKQMTVLFLCLLCFFLLGEAASSLYRNNNYYYNLDNHIADYLDMQDFEEFQFEEVEDQILDNEFLQEDSKVPEKIDIPNYFYVKQTQQLRPRISPNKFDLKPGYENSDNNDNDDNDDNSINEELLRRLKEFKSEYNIELTNTVAYISLGLFSIWGLVLLI